MSKLRVARSAVADLDEIWLYIAQKQSIETAERVVSFITGKFALLAASSGIGRRHPELGPEIRSFPVQNYRIYYREEKRGIVRILYVRDAKREELKLLG